MADVEDMMVEIEVMGVLTGGQGHPINPDHDQDGQRKKCVHQDHCNGGRLE